MMVTVVATQELKAGDVLRRFGPETAPDEPRRGNSNIRCRAVRVVAVAGVWKLSSSMGLFTVVFFYFFF